MFAYADQDKDGKISWTEFQVIIHLSIYLSYGTLFHVIWMSLT